MHTHTSRRDGLKSCPEFRYSSVNTGPAKSRKHVPACEKIQTFGESRVYHLKGKELSGTSRKFNKLVKN